MDILDKIGKKATDAYNFTADKTGKLAKETKLKFKMNELKGQINDIYEEIGKKVYEKHTLGENISIKDDLEEECTKIDVLSSEVEEILQKCLELKDKKQCPKCFKEIEKSVKFCPNCGEKQEEVIKEDVILEPEIIENNEEEIKKNMESNQDVAEDTVIEDTQEQTSEDINSEENN